MFSGAELNYTYNVNRGVKHTPLSMGFFTTDKQGHTFNISVVDDKGNVDLSGSSVLGWFIPNDKNLIDDKSIPLEGITKGNVATVSLPEKAYIDSGRFSFVIQVSKDNVTSTIFWATGRITRGKTDSLVDVDGVIPSLEDLLAQIETIKTATNLANNAAQRAIDAAEYAGSLAINASGYAENAGKLGGRPAEEYALKNELSIGTVKSVNGVEADEEGDIPLKLSNVLPDSNEEDGTDTVLFPVVADNALKLGGKAPQYYIRPYNLLDNSDFRNPVNQRKAQETAGTYSHFIDRWVTGNAAVNFALYKNGMTINNPIRQHIEFDRVAGKTLTLAVKVDGNIYCGSGAIPSAYGGSWSVYINVTMPNGKATVISDNAEKVQIRIEGAAGVAILVEWAALYEGEYAADTLPPYVPKGYAVELAECQSHEVVYKASNAIFPVGYCFKWNAEKCVGNILLPVAFADTVASFVITGSACVNNESCQITSFSRRNISANNLCIDIFCDTSSLESGKMYPICLTANSILIISDNL